MMMGRIRTLSIITKMLMLTMMARTVRLSIPTNRMVMKRTVIMMMEMMTPVMMETMMFMMTKTMALMMITMAMVLIVITKSDNDDINIKDIAVIL